tara:strand:- start:7316 stop:7660 length:345 start_codon:yes stop_codon:yes gene_type:complete
MNAFKRFADFLADSLIKYKQAFVAFMVAVVIFFPLYVVKDLQMQGQEVDSMREQIDILGEVQRTITFHENEIESQREHINRQNQIINQLILELRKLRGMPIPAQPEGSPSRSEA